MRVSYKWLNQYMDLSDITPAELAEKMSRTGIEVDDVLYPGKGLTKIVVGETLEVADHPDSDHLHICQVNIGEEETVQIVCGAPNVAAGQKVIVALHGARIAGNAKIKKGKIRGQASEGMICSLQELGYPENVIPKKYAEGIFVLPADARPGADAIRLLDLDDSILDLDITPNRADALSMRGSAHEVAAIYNKKLKLTSLAAPGTGKVTDYMQVKVESTDDVPAYHILIIEGVTVKESPLWLQTRLMNAGIRPLNNVVDITNYILLEYGQPLHAFDYDAIGSKQILVRRAKDQEEFTTLDGVERILSADNIVITNGEKPLALAGIMGGLDSEITDQTTTVALEAALFDPLTIRRTASAFNLRSESSSRFEKGINKATILPAGEHAAALICELAGGTLVEGAASVNTVEAKDTLVTISLAKINRTLGTEVSGEEVSRIFEQLGFSAGLKEGVFTVAVPPRRWDIAIEADIIEEVARIYGYDRLPATLPVTPSVAGELTAKQKMMRFSHRYFEAAGLTQNISYVLTSAEKAARFQREKTAGIRLAFPMSEERSTLRMNLVGALLDNAAYNSARKNTDLMIYEIGRIFFPQDGVPLPLESERIAGLLTGAAYEKDWQYPTEPVTFYHAKGIVEGYFDQAGITSGLSYVAEKELEWMHPGRTASIYLEDRLIGYVGQIHPKVAAEFNLKETYIFELDFDAVSVYPTEAISQQPIPKYPGTARDIALLVDSKTTNQSIMAVIRANGGDYLHHIRLFDVYEGKGIEPGKKSLAYSLSFLNPNATLMDEEIQAVMEKLQLALQEQCGAVIR